MRQNRDLLLPLRQARTIVRLEYVAVPAAAHVMDHVEREMAQHGFRGRREAQTRMVAGQSVQNEIGGMNVRGQSHFRWGENWDSPLFGHDMDFVSAGQ